MAYSWVHQFSSYQPFGGWLDVRMVFLELKDGRHQKRSKKLTDGQTKLWSRGTIGTAASHWLCSGGNSSSWDMEWLGCKRSFIIAVRPPLLGPLPVAGPPSLGGAVETALQDESFPKNGMPTLIYWSNLEYILLSSGFWNQNILGQEEREELNRGTCNLTNYSQEITTPLPPYVQHR